jgi:hypothetical protein
MQAHKRRRRKRKENRAFAAGVFKERLRSLLFICARLLAVICPTVRLPGVISQNLPAIDREAIPPIPGLRRKKRA